MTGLPQMLAAHGWAQAMIGFFGGIDVTRDLHHFAAIVPMLEVARHLVSLGYRLFVGRVHPTMLPGARDVTDAWGHIALQRGPAPTAAADWALQLRGEGRILGFRLGTVIMAITGFMLWNPIATARLLPGEFIPAAKSAHGSEAVLAVLAIIVWHLYSVHIRRFNKSMWTGKLTAAEMSEEHPLEWPISRPAVPSPNSTR